MAESHAYQITSFIHDTRFCDLPDAVVHQTRRCLLDLIGVAVAGNRTHLSSIVRDHAHNQSPGSQQAPRLLFDGRHVGAAHSAFANAATIDAMDGHDGHRMTKGHAGVAVLPATLAFIDGGPERDMGEFITALAVGYEIALRAGIALHRTASDYHSSGAWNALGAAAVGSRLLGLDVSATWNAFGIAEYSAPRAPMMRTIDHPAMVKDSSAWGAQAGVSATLLADDGFTGSPPELMMTEEMASLGSNWLILDQYFKPYPVCRWSHPAVDAALSIIGESKDDLDAIDHVEVVTFEAATRLSTRRPSTTEEAQYSLPFAVAAAVVHGGLTPDVVLEPMAGPLIQGLADRMILREDPDMTRRFPAQREAAVSIAFANGRTVSSGVFTADGDPDSPLGDDQLLTKFRLYAKSLGTARVDRIVAMAGSTSDSSVRGLLDELAIPVVAP